MFQENKFEYLIEQAAKLNKTSYKNIMSTNRQRFIVGARNMVYAFLLENHWGCTKIGRAFGKNHASVIHGCRNHENDYKTFDYYRKTYDNLVLIMAENTDMDEVVKLRAKQRAKDELENLQNENARLKEKIYDLKEKTRKVLQAHNESTMLTQKLHILCS